MANLQWQWIVWINVCSVMVGCVLSCSTLTWWDWKLLFPPFVVFGSCSYSCFGPFMLSISFSISHVCFSFIFPFSSSSICFCSILSSPFSSFSNFCPSDMLLMFSFPTSPSAHSIPLLVLPSFYSRLQAGSSKGPKPVVMRWLERVLLWRPVLFWAYLPKKTIIHFAITAPPIWAINALPIEVINVPPILSHEYPIHLSHKFHIPISQYILTSQFMYVWIMNINFPTHNLWNCNS